MQEHSAWHFEIAKSLLPRLLSKIGQVEAIELVSKNNRFIGVVKLPIDVSRDFFFNKDLMGQFDPASPSYFIDNDHYRRESAADTLAGLTTATPATNKRVIDLVD